MVSTALIAVALSTALALVALGGGAYEFLVVDPVWPRRPDIIQPERGGISRRRFWIPAHAAFEACLVAALVLAWSTTDVRLALLIALSSHALMRLWSLFDFIPKALAFERADPASIQADAAQRWVRRSIGRLPLDLIKCGALVTALVIIARAP
jgi:hypothetical protein